MTGAVLFGLTYPQIMPKITALANLGNVVIPDLWNVSPVLFILLFAMIAILLFYFIDRAGLSRKKDE